MKRVALAVALTLASFAVREGVARADDDAPEALFAKGAAALERGAYQEAIDDLESLSDRGFVHPDASFDRGVAYLQRVRAKNDKPGDLGRAAAAFEEAARLRPGDEAAAGLLERVKGEVTRRRSRRGRDDIDARPTLDRVLVGLASETTWGAFAIAASALLTIGLALRARARASAAHVAGSILAPVALVALLIFTPLAVGARWLSSNTRPGVIVAADAPLSAKDGKPLKGQPIPEAASVETGAREGGLVHVRWGARTGWVPASSVRLMPR